MPDLDPIKMTTAPTASLRAYFRFITHSPAAETMTQDGLFYYQTGSRHPWFNGVQISRLPPSDASILVDHIAHFFKERGIEHYSLWLEDEAWLGAWAEHLQPAGFSVIRDIPGMSVDLAQLPGSVPVPAGFSIRKVEDLEALKTWTRTFIQGFGLPDSSFEPFYTLLASAGIDLPVVYYIGYLNGQPVTTSQLFLMDGIAGIYCVATLPQARGLGLGAAITLQPLLEAHTMGTNIGALQSSNMGFRVYQRLGFKKVCDVVYFSR